MYLLRPHQIHIWRDYHRETWIFSVRTVLFTIGIMPMLYLRPFAELVCHRPAQGLRWKASQYYNTHPDRLTFEMTLQGALWICLAVTMSSGMCWYSITLLGVLVGSLILRSWPFGINDLVSLSKFLLAKRFGHNVKFPRGVPNADLDRLSRFDCYVVGPFTTHDELIEQLRANTFDGFIGPRYVKFLRRSQAILFKLQSRAV